MIELLDFLFNPALLQSTLRQATPILLACLAGLFAERSGIVDIGLEGKLLVAAFASAAFAAVTGNAWLGMLMGVWVSVLFSLLHGFASITLGGNQLISGVAINFMALGLTGFLGKAWFHQGGNTPQLVGNARFEAITLPGAEAIANVPIIGPFYSGVLSGHAIWVYVAFLLVPVVAWVVYKTRFGLRLLAVGEEPAAVDTAGISVPRIRYMALIIAGVLVGLGGVYLSNGMLAGFGPRMSAERGYMALAALIFAKWRPWQSMWTCLLFGYFSAFSIRYGSHDFPILVSLGVGLIIFVALYAIVGKRSFLRDFATAALVWAVIMGFAAILMKLAGIPIDASTRLPSQFMDALPYMLTMIVLGGLIGKAIAPKAIGRPYVKEH